MTTVRCALTAHALVWVVMAGLPAIAAGQQSGGPFEQLFGREPDRGAGEWSALDVRGAIGSEWSDNLFPTVGLEPGADTRRGGFTAATNGRVLFARHSSTSDLKAGATVIYREYFARPSSFGATSEIATVSYVANPTTRLRFDMGGTFSRQPFFQMLPLALQDAPAWIAPVGETPFVTFMQQNHSISGQAGASYSLSKRSTVSGSFTRSSVYFTDAIGSNYSAVGVDGGFRHHLTRDLALRVGYGRYDYRTSTNESDRYIDERVDIGVEFMREISIARRTTFGFGTQTSMLRDREAGRSFRLNGNVNLTKWFQRTWRSSLTAQRTTEFIPGFYKPVYSDTATALIGGMLTHRTQWAASVGGGQGQYGGDPAAPTFSTVIASSRLMVGLTRKLGVHVVYSMMHYGAPSSSIDGIMPVRGWSRQSVTAGVNIWLPVYLQEKAPLGSQ